ncbi:MAG: hypothetical protein H7Y02_06170, partial [Candidatus Obscuribacterales bacterium]|nr:hypothetical protein [Steroidobacteraceae bacterium]
MAGAFYSVRPFSLHIIFVETMFKKNKRILWLLNHRTLMPYEASLIQRLGFEIYVPKIIPKTDFRSGAIDFSYDSSLSLPDWALRELNRFNFYENAWTSKIVTIVNRYFGSAFIMPYARQASEAVENFEGQLVLRAFGLPNDQSYKRALDFLYGTLMLRKIKGIKHRFWFGEGYDNVHECDDRLFEERALLLPIGVPDVFFATAGQWTGSEKKILLVCPNILSAPYYADIYQRFKRDFGRFPHVIVGYQEVPVSDPHVLGFVSDDQLERLYLNCAVLYYPSTELRHVHYSPIEAAINGMPVIFFENSLLARLGGSAQKGRVSSVSEAQQLVERILANDIELIAEIKADQREIAFHFSDEYCRKVWKAQMEERGFMQTLKENSRLSTLIIEAKRTLLTPFAHGRTKINPHKLAIEPSRTSLTAQQAIEIFGRSLYEGITFRDPEFSEMVDYIDGLSSAEDWGRWSISEKVVIVLKHTLIGEFRLFIRGVAFGKNASTNVPIRIGDQIQNVRLPAGLDQATGAWLRFNLKRSSNVIEITVPHPTRPEVDARTIGVGLIELRAAPPVTLSATEARNALGS